MKLRMIVGKKGIGLLLVFAINAFILACTDKGDENALFKLISPDQTQITFRNDLKETKDFNILEFLYMYNGGGVAIGDVNNDGLPDIYFTANQLPNRLYLNKGGMRFEDITDQAGVQGGVADSDWTTGATMVDINNDGWLDIHVCQVHGFKGLKGGNKLFVNNQDGTFTDKAAQYGLRIKSYAQQATFFDHDLDGDLDMYLLNFAVHTPDSYKPASLRVERDSLAGDRLFENNNGVFTDVSEEAGIYGGAMGYGLAVAISDLNNDGFPDIYVSNDFHENDYLYYNNGDGTFTEDVRGSMGHISTFSMGSDIADINNDGWQDIITLDMKPADEQILKTLVAEDDYNIYSLKFGSGYHYQFPRNMLQLNRGNLQGNRPSFSEIAEFNEVAATDWSWGPLFADFDMDGLKDVFITNGIPRRPNNLDFINFTSNEKLYKKDIPFSELIASIPDGKASNRAFKNSGGKFEDVSRTWGLDLEGYSNGGAYADLDNDGDLDLVVNNLNAQASVYKNSAVEQKAANYIKIELQGSPGNVDGIGAKITLTSDTQRQVQEFYPTRGWLSGMSSGMIFGLGANDRIREVAVQWPDGRIQSITDITANRTIVVAYADATPAESIPRDSTGKIFQNVNRHSGITYRHIENDFIDFEYEKLIPKMLSREGPRMAVGDINNDGLDDFYIGGGKNQEGELYIQQKDADLLFQRISNADFFADRASEDAGSVFLDVNNDGFLDLYVVSGGSEPFQDFTKNDRLYINDGGGNFYKSETHPQLSFNGSCAVTGDFNEDGITDIFVGARSIPGTYGKYIRSRILLGNGKGELFDITARVFGDRVNLGMVTDAAWLPDSRELVVVGEWMDVTILDFKFLPLQEKKIEKTAGWWNTIHAADIDTDGDLDLLLGNLGTNTNLKASVTYPVNLYLKDLDNNQNPDPILSHYKNGLEYPYFGLDVLSKQLVSLKKAYPDYQSFANSSFTEVFPKEQLHGAGRLQAFTFESAFFENLGAGRFRESSLPEALQMSSVYGFAAGDFDFDGETDILAVGNYSGNQVKIGNQDASYGEYVTVDGDSLIMKTADPQHTGFVVQGEARDVRILRGPEGKGWVLVSRNNQEMEVFGFHP